MTRTVLFIQGAGEGTHQNWDNKLVDSLSAHLGEGYDIHYPAMPDEGDPTIKGWTRNIASEWKVLPDGALLVGHSFGGTTLLYALAAAAPPFRPGGLFLIAPPFFGKGGWAPDKAPKVELGAAIPADTPVFLYYGSDDDTVPSDHVDLYRQVLPQMTVRHLKGRDHQMNDDLSEVAADIRRLG